MKTAQCCLRERPSWKGGGRHLGGRPWDRLGEGSHALSGQTKRPAALVNCCVLGDVGAWGRGVGSVFGLPEGVDGDCAPSRTVRAELGRGWGAACRKFSEVPPSHPQLPSIHFLLGRSRVQCRAPGILENERAYASVGGGTQDRKLLVTTWQGACSVSPRLLGDRGGVMAGPGPGGSSSESSGRVFP